MMAQEIGQDEILIGDSIYDISEFKKKHPGGSIINYYAASCGTEPFIEFHARSNKAKKVLQGLKKRPSGIPQDPLVRDFVELREQLEKERYFETSYVHVAFRILELLGLICFGMYLIKHDAPFLGILLLGIGRGRIGWFMHEGGHNSLTGSPKADKILQSLFFGIGFGMSGNYWNNQHNKHHAAPQKLEYDVDVKTLPFVAFNVAVKADNVQLSKAERWWLRYQAYFYSPIVTFIVVLAWGFLTHPRYMIRTRRYFEFSCAVVHYFLFYYFYGAAVTLITAWIAGAYMLSNFTLSHTHKPVVAPTEYKRWIEYSANHTTNIQPSWWCDWWMGYLNYQIEHHLFPTMPQFRNKEIAHRVRALLEKHGLPSCSIVLGSSKSYNAKS